MDAKELQRANARLRDAAPEAILAYALEAFLPRLSFACSLGLEDVALLDMLARMEQRPERRPEIFVLDTGRLPQETYDTLAAVRERYGLPIQVYFPRAEAVEALVSRKGPNSFYESLENRQECCRIRKVEPLGRALAGQDAWITGLRRDQALSRSGLSPFEDDPAHGLVRVSPLAGWSLEQVRGYVQRHQVPYNKLHDQGYPTLGCAPCTRPVAAGEPLRAGRWWWEEPEHKECGLHQRTPAERP